MATDIALTANTRQNLLSLTNTTTLMARTQGRLATGLRVATALDDAVAYFQAKGLTDRSDDYTVRKDEIDQGISSLKAAVNAVESIDKIAKQMKGLLLSAKSASDSERADLSSQFNELAQQMNHLSNDAEYQGLNLVNGTTAKLSVNFSVVSTAKLDVNGVDLRASKLIIGTAASVIATKMTTGGSKWSKASLTKSSHFDVAIRTMDDAINTLRGNAKTLGSNVALLQTRLDFTKQYTNTLEEGAGKLTLADLNEEGANFVALQTRQQLGIQSLQFAGQTEQAVMQLFR